MSSRGLFGRFRERARCSGLFLFTFLFPLGTRAGATPPAPEPEVAEPSEQGATETPEHWGLMFDLGTTDGGTLSGVYRPLPWLRAHGGVGTNGSAVGVKAGGVVSPLGPSYPFTLEVGHYFPGDVNGLVQLLVGSDYEQNALFENFDYNFVNLHAGWQIERGPLTFFVQGGASFVWAELNGVAEIIQDASRDLDANTAVSVDDNSSLRALIPSLKIGLIGYL